MLGQLEISSEGDAVPHRRGAPTSFREGVIMQIDSVRHEYVGRAYAWLGIAAIERCRAAHVQPIAAALVAMVDELRLLPQSGIDGLPVEGPHER